MTGVRASVFHHMSLLDGISGFAQGSPMARMRCLLAPPDLRDVPQREPGGALQPTQRHALDQRQDLARER